MIESIVLPDGKSYSFLYEDNSFGAVVANYGEAGARDIWQKMQAAANELTEDEIRAYINSVFHDIKKSQSAVPKVRKGSGAEEDISRQCALGNRAAC